MGHGLHGFRLQGQEAARLPLVPALLPVPSDLPHLLEGIELLWVGGMGRQTASGHGSPWQPTPLLHLSIWRCVPFCSLASCEKFLNTES